MEESLHQLISSLSHYLQGLYIPGAGFLPSTVFMYIHCKLVTSYLHELQILPSWSSKVPGRGRCNACWLWDTQNIQKLIGHSFCVFFSAGSFNGVSYILQGPDPTDSEHQISGSGDVGCVVVFILWIHVSYQHKNITKHFRYLKWRYWTL